jgi:hypothetical protein
MVPQVKSITTCIKVLVQKSGDLSLFQDTVRWVKERRAQGIHPSILFSDTTFHQVKIDGTIYSAFIL